ncbi:DUF2878 family protein [Polyangium jinanense]|uniref:DUF2878 family protein n=1 Tax=Polyangium jinanense TaxID=2829994 RepID=A0A9X3XFH3_9BACT|nr:DUF2878 family protein [Polyangium jinanense]MDC3988420.1 DUF2878 family protein [Polyangium jinanense]
MSPPARPLVARSPRELVLALVACTALLTVGDQFHVQFGVLSYSSDFRPFGQPWWVAPSFALAIFGFILAAWRPSAHVVEPTRRSIVLDGAWFFGSYAMTGILGAHIVPVTVLLTGAWLGRVLRRPDRRVVIAFSAVLGVLGTLGEIALHATGACAYEHRELVLVPLWLPALYLQGAPFALSVTRWLRGRPWPGC